MTEKQGNDSTYKHALDILDRHLPLYEAFYRDREWAFVAVSMGPDTSSLSIAVLDQPGYVEVLSGPALGDYDSLRTVARTLNARRGITPDQAARIVCSTFGTGDNALQPDIGYQPKVSDALH